jgi:hypothetical protein
VRYASICAAGEAQTFLQQARRHHDVSRTSARGLPYSLHLDSISPLTATTAQSAYVAAAFANNAADGAVASVAGCDTRQHANGRH